MYLSKIHIIAVYIFVLPLKYAFCCTYICLSHSSASWPPRPWFNIKVPYQSKISYCAERAVVRSIYSMGISILARRYLYKINQSRVRHHDHHICGRHVVVGSQYKRPDNDNYMGVIDTLLMAYNKANCVYAYRALLLINRLYDLQLEIGFILLSLFHNSCTDGFLIFFRVYYKQKPNCTYIIWWYIYTYNPTFICFTIVKSRINKINDLFHHASTL